MTVKDIQHLSPDLQPHALADLEMLQQPEVFAGCSEPPQIGVPSGAVAQLVACRDREVCQIEVEIAWIVLDSGIEAC
jgi:hypothetical protein